MIIVRAEITVETVADAIDQLEDYHLDTLAKFIVEEDIGQAVKLSQHLERYIKAA